MTPDRWKAVDQILDAVYDLDEDADRSAVLDRLCDGDAALRAEVLSILEAEDDAPAFLDGHAAHLAAPFLDDTVSAPRGDGADGASAPPHVIDVGARVGPYRLVSELGHGGMSVVYLAERADGQFAQQVALKLLPRAFETADRIARFRAERQILASLDHPGIARLLDGGVTRSGRPYLVMERVDGVPITEYCATHHLNLPDRLRLMQQVCVAVNHAHRRLVVHRDLKPSNILVTDTATGPQVKLLDFGIAKLLDAEPGTTGRGDGAAHRDGHDGPDGTGSAWTMPVTRTGVHLMTPPYAAPEQVRNTAITTATDVYQLGVLTYELLAGCRPLACDDRSLAGIERAVLDTTPDAPSVAVTRAAATEAFPVSVEEWSRQLRGDLDVILLTALRKEPDRRYASADAFCADLQRYLDGEPVTARPATLRYRTAKFVARHRWSVAATTLLLALVTAFVVLLAHQRQVALTERDRAQHEADKAEQVAGFLSDLFESADPAQARGSRVTADVLLARGVDRIDAIEDPLVQARMRRTIGEVYRRLGTYDRARPLLEQAVYLDRLHAGDDALSTASSLDALGLLLCDEGAFEAAEAALREALAIRRDHPDAEAVSLAETSQLLGYALRRQGRYDAAEPLFRSALALRRTHLGPSHPETIGSVSSLATVLHNRGHYRAAEEKFRTVLTQRRAVLGPRHPDLAISLNSLASLLLNLGRFDEAEPLLREALAMRRDLFGAAHPKIALSMNNLALALREQGAYADAESLFVDALAMRRDRLGDRHTSTAISHYALGGLMLDTGRYAEAREHFVAALSVFRATLPPDHSFTARTRVSLGRAHLGLGDPDRAATLMEAGFRQVRAVHDDTSLEYALAAAQMAALHQHLGHVPRAETLLRTALTTLQTLETTPTLRQQRIQAALQAVQSKR